MRRLISSYPWARLSWKFRSNVYYQQMRYLSGRHWDGKHDFKHMLLMEGEL